MSWKALLALVVALIVVFSWTATRGRSSPSATDQATVKLAIRQIGHQLLLQAGDSTSRILPVEERSNREYMIRFTAPFTFLPDTLVATVRRVVAANRLPASYRVEVIQCAPSAEVIYGFQIFKDSNQNIVPCLGRMQEKACYHIMVRFMEAEAAGMGPFSTGLFAGIVVAVLIGSLLRILYVRRRSGGRSGNLPVPDAPGMSTTDHQDSPNILPDISPEEAIQEVQTTPGIAIGNLVFLRESQQLVAGSSIIILTAKEAKLLHVFAKAQQEVIDRDQLMKEVWEDEGVIVGRSLDMFVSKLRKKLQADKRISILNIHGKGYKLVVSHVTY